jgi:hypothetical protein
LLRQGSAVIGNRTAEQHIGAGGAQSVEFADDIARETQLRFTHQAPATTVHNHCQRGRLKQRRDAFRALHDGYRYAHAQAFRLD